MRATLRNLRAADRCRFPPPWIAASNLLKKVISSNPSKRSEVGAVLKSNAEKNIDLVQEYVHKLADAKDFQDAIRAQSEFIQSQFTAIGEQTKSFSSARGKLAASVFGYPFKNVA
jgi:hypothetical protein